MILTYRTRIGSGGRVPKITRDALNEFFVSNEGKLVDVSVKVVTATRSNQQNRYYFGCIVPIICEAFKDLGHRINREECHEFLKSKCNPVDVITPDGEFLGSLPGSTKELSTAEFSEYVDRVVRWSSEVLGVTIPEAEKQMTIL